MNRYQKFKEYLNIFASSVWCPIVLSLFGFVSYFANYYIAIILVMLLWSGFALACLKNVKAITMPILLVLVSNGKTIYFHGANEILFYTALGIFCACGVYYLFCAFRHKKSVKFDPLFIALFVALVGVTISGCLYKPYQKIFVSHLHEWVPNAVELLVAYFVLSNCLSLNPNEIGIAGKTQQPLNTIPPKTFNQLSFSSYIMSILLIVALMVSVGLINGLLKANANFITAARYKMYRPNGRSINSFAPYITFGLIACVYFTTKTKYKPIFFLLMVFLSIMLLLTFTRAMIFITLGLLLVLLIYAFAKSSNKKYYGICLAATAAAYIIIVLTIHLGYPEISKHFIKMGLNGNGRNYWWDIAIAKFKQNPLFGIGYYGDTSGEFMSDKWCFHCTPLHLLAASGIFGSLLILPYFIAKYWTFFRNRSQNNAYLFMAMFALALQGLIDIPAFSFDKNMVVVLLCAFAVAAGKSGAPLFKQSKEENKMESQIKPKKKFYRDYVKRALDFSIALFALLLLWPVLAIIAIISRINIGRPVIFAQPRPGKNCKVFMFYKFRSMSNKVDENGMPLPDAQRITKWGKFIRKTSFDELPQLWNILKGDMSIVGPRPRMVKDMVFYPQEVMDAYTVRPGLTGYDQVYGRNKNSWETIFEMDKEYAEKCSFGLDCKLFFATFVSVFKNKGSSDGSNTSKREYWYSDYLLKSNQIPQTTYDQGLKLAKQIEDLKYTGENINIKTKVQEEFQHESQEQKSSSDNNH